MSGDNSTNIDDKRRARVREMERARYARNPNKYREKTRKYYHENRDECIRKAKSYRATIPSLIRLRSKEWRKRNREFLDQIIRQSCCWACGMSDFRCLQFHHVGKKTMEIAKMSYCSRIRLVCELAKCEILCANCHLRYHAGTIVYKEFYHAK